MSASIEFGTTQIDASTKIGIVDNGNGSFTALTMVASKTFKSVRGAAAWLDKRGFTAKGERKEQDPPLPPSPPAEPTGWVKTVVEGGFGIYEVSGEMVTKVRDLEVQ